MTRQELKNLSNQTFPDNTAGNIAAAGHRQFNNEIIDAYALSSEVTASAANAKEFAVTAANSAEMNSKRYADTLAESIKYISLRFSFNISTNRWSVTHISSNLENINLLNINLVKDTGSDSVVIGNITYDGVNWFGPSIQASLGKNLNANVTPWDNKIPFRIEVPYDGASGPGESRKLNIQNLLGISGAFIFSVNISCIFKE